MTEQTKRDTVSEALYRFFAAFDGFDASHPLGFEAEVPAARNGVSDAAEMAAVFTMEPALTYVRRYINGGGQVRGACTVSGRVREYDGAKRHETAAFFAALTEYVRDCGKRYEDGGRVYVIRPAAHPAWLRLHADGAVWELRCSVEIFEKQ